MSITGAPAFEPVHYPRRSGCCRRHSVDTAGNALKDGRPLQCLVHFGLRAPQQYVYRLSRIVSTLFFAAGVKLMLLHDVKNDDGIKQFFLECHELYIKARSATNPSLLIATDSI